MKAVFESDCKWRLVEEFGVKSFRELDSGKLLFQADYTDKENLITWLLSFREKAVLLEPVEIREELKKAIRKMQDKYEDYEEGEPDGTDQTDKGES